MEFNAEIRQWPQTVERWCRSRTGWLCFLAWLYEERWTSIHQPLWCSHRTRTLPGSTLEPLCPRVHHQDQKISSSWLGNIRLIALPSKNELAAAASDSEREKEKITVFILSFSGNLIAGIKDLGGNSSWCLLGVCVQHNPTCSINKLT